MTEEQHNKFLTLLMGECWHEWVDDGAWNICQICGDKTRLHNPENPNHLSNPLLVIRWVEKEMPEVLEEYLCHISEVTVTNIDWIEEVINLRNLVDYLWEYPEWGEKECPNCDGYGVLEGFGEPEFHCQECHGTGKITHPALKYLRSIKWKE
jgi:hypothetical protein